MNKEMLIKVAQINKAARHELRTRMMKRAGMMLNIRDATPEEDNIYRLKKKRDKSLLRDILEGVGVGGLFGLGAGGIGGTSYAAINQALGGGNPLRAKKYLLNTGLTGLSWGTPIGAAAGGLYKLITHEYRKQNAINKLKELGVEDTIEK